MDNLSVMFPERQYVGKPSRVPGVKNIHLKFFDRQIRIRCHDIVYFPVCSQYCKLDYYAIGDLSEHIKPRI